MASQQTQPPLNTNRIQAVSRVAEILAMLSTGRQQLHIADVAKQLGLGRSTAHRYLASLADAKLLTRDSVGAYGPGALLVQFWTSALGAKHLLELARLYMERLNRDVGQTCVLSLWGGEGAVVAAVHADERRLAHVVVRVGGNLPLDSAQSLLFIAHLEDKLLAERLISQLPLVRRDHIGEEFERLRRSGLAVNSQVVEGIRTLAAPIFGTDRHVLATLAIVGTNAGVPQNADSGMARALIQTSRELSERLAQNGS